MPRATTWGSESALWCLLVGGDVPQALPLVGLHGQPAQRLHATVDAQAVAQQHVHDPLQAGRDHHVTTTTTVNTVTTTTVTTTTPSLYVHAASAY